MAGDKLTHDELLGRVLDLLEDICDDDEVRDHLDEDLFELGFLDSMGAIELLVRIEDEFGVSIAPTEVERSEMNTVNLIVYQIEQRL
ncbi:MAG: D-alanine--poly(phosphoribitol) ligase subunit DltC [Coriobacteriia bacterium]|nr:D-alanine--poly(phosphoribitol) ligase subunit DltC [Coriobacteriia bacterium]MBS5477704.1 D-alanine--poly(phosphoribitol) ligase subunit DltC [Coriobacteriia bacterium]